MNKNAPTGLGEPDSAGKKALFRPPVNQATGGNTITKPVIAISGQVKKQPEQRFRTTIELTPQALMTVQDIQQSYRLRFGKSLPLWKAVCEIIERCGENFRVS